MIPTLDELDAIWSAAYTTEIDRLFPSDGGQPYLDCLTAARKAGTAALRNAILDSLITEADRWALETDLEREDTGEPLTVADWLREFGVQP